MPNFGTKMIFSTFGMGHAHLVGGEGREDGVATDEEDEVEVDVWRRGDSNRGPLDLKASMLTTQLMGPLH